MSRSITGLVGVTVAGALVFTAAGTATAGEREGDSQQTRIVNGRYPAPGEMSSTVAVYNLADSGFCGGTLVTPTKVVTAAHCVVSDNGTHAGASQLHVTAGEDLRTPTQVARVAAVAAHYTYRPDLLGVGDVAVLTLANPITVARTTVVAGPAEAATLLAAGTPARTSGWGDLTIGGQVFAPQRMVTDLLIHPAVACGPPTVYTVAGTQFYALGAPDPSMVTCAAGMNQGRVTIPGSGDSGGPLTVGQGAGERLVGAVSFGPTRSTTIPKPVAFTRLSAYSTWLTSQGVPVTGTTPPAAPTPPAPTPPAPTPPAPTPPAPTPPPSGPEPDYVRPAALALPASGRRGTVITLRYRVYDDDSAMTRERAVVRGKGGVVLNTMKTAMWPTVNGAIYTFKYRAPKKPATRTWCVQSIDKAGNVGAWSCAPLRIR